ncbi:unnamed protein product [Leuciscus chuanchicus]
MSETHRLQTEENKRNSTDMLFDAAEGPSKSRISSDVLSPAYRATKQLELTQQQWINAAKHMVKAEQECVFQREAPRGQRQNKSISAAHPAIYLNTHSHKLLRRAIRIWKMPVPMLNCTRSSKHRNFQEQQKQVEMLRNHSGDSDARTRSVRDLQLGLGTDSSPLSSTSSEPGRRTAHNTRRRNREQLRWHRMLSRRGRQGDEKPHRPREGQSSPAGSCWVKGSCEYPDAGRDDPVRTSRRKLDSSRSETSLINQRPDTHTRKHTRVSFYLPDESKTSGCSRTEVDCHDINSNLSKEASASEQKNVDNQDSSDLKLAVQTSEKLIPQSSLKITATNMEEQNCVAPLVPQLKIFKDEFNVLHCEDIKHQSDSPQIEMPSHTQSHTHTPRPPSCVKWKSVLLQSISVSFERTVRTVLPETHTG